MPSISYDHQWWNPYRIQILSCEPCSNAHHHCELSTFALHISVCDLQPTKTMEFGYSPPTTPIVPCPAGLAMLLKLPQLLRLLLDPGIEALGSLPWSIERNVVSSTAKTLLCFFKSEHRPSWKTSHIVKHLSFCALHHQIILQRESPPKSPTSTCLLKFHHMPFQRWKIHDRRWRPRA